MFKKLREWGFPAGLMVAWLVTFAYTLSVLVEASRTVAAPHLRPATAAAKHPGT